jgi:hypothetical protein
MALVAQGDDDALRLLVHRHHGRLVGYLRGVSVRRPPPRSWPWKSSSVCIGRLPVGAPRRS